MIVVDTSVWINALRDRNSSEARHLTQLLDADEAAIAINIRIEILSGAPRADMPRLGRLLSALPTFYPSETTWQRIEQWLGTIKSSGDRFGVGDLIIAALGAEHQAAVWSLDSDFSRMARLKLIEIHRPAA
jgi:predicted nucleic acid-binding protein